MEEAGFEMGRIKKHLCECALAIEALSILARLTSVVSAYYSS